MENIDQLLAFALGWERVERDADENCGVSSVWIGPNGRHIYNGPPVFHRDLNEMYAVEEELVKLELMDDYVNELVGKDSIVTDNSSYAEDGYTINDYVICRIVHASAEERAKAALAVLGSMLAKRVKDLYTA